MEFPWLTKWVNSRIYDYVGCINGHNLYPKYDSYLFVCAQAIKVWTTHWLLVVPACHIVMSHLTPIDHYTPAVQTFAHFHRRNCQHWHICGHDWCWFTFVCHKGYLIEVKVACGTLIYISASRKHVNSASNSGLSTGSCCMCGINVLCHTIRTMLGLVRVMHQWT